MVGKQAGWDGGNESSSLSAWLEGDRSTQTSPQVGRYKYILVYSVWTLEKEGIHPKLPDNRREEIIPSGTQVTVEVVV